MEKEYLPIGTVVSVNNSVHKLMIMGYKFYDTKKPKEIRKEHDYVACLFPEGQLNSETMFVFDHEMITKVYFEGFNTPESQEILTKLKNKENKNAD